MQRTKWLLAWFGLVMIVLATAVEAKPPKPITAAKPQRFIRLRRDPIGEPIALETAIVRYVPVEGNQDLSVDLVSVVHIADRRYYRKLNRILSEYDVVLYELVAPKGTRVPQHGPRRKNVFARLQKLAGLYLGLRFQIEEIDYTRDNFVHADLSPEGMAQAMRRRGEDGLTLFLGIMRDLLRQKNLAELKAEQEKAKQAKTNRHGQPQADTDEEEPDFLSLLLDPEGPARLKRMLAEQLAMADDPGSSLGTTLANLLIEDRNAAAIQVLQKELVRGRKRIAIFYGAAHMPDFDRRLRADFGFKRAGVRWLTAWDLE